MKTLIALVLILAGCTEADVRLGYRGPNGSRVTCLESVAVNSGAECQYSETK